MKKQHFLFAAMAAVMAILFSACAPKVTMNVVTTEMVKAVQDITINKTSDYRKVEPIGVMRWNQTSKKLDEFGDYMLVDTGATNGWTWVDPYKEITQSNDTARMFVCANKIGASLLDKGERPYNAIGVITNGQIVKLVKFNPTWYKIDVDTDQGPRTGWVSAGKKYTQTYTVVTTNYVTNK